MTTQIDSVDVMIGKLASALDATFDQLHISRKVLEALGRSEAVAWHSVAPESNVDDVVQMCHRRDLGLRFVETFLKSYLGACYQDLVVLVWFQVARILRADRESYAGGHASVSVVLARASAVVALALGLESSAFKRRPLLEALASQASAFGVPLGGDKVSIRAIEEHQRQLLKSLVAAPSVATWLALYLARLEACFKFSNPNVGDALVKVKHMAFSLAFLSIGSSPFHRELPPKQVSLGCLSLALLATGLVSVHVFDQAGSPAVDRENVQIATLCVAFDQPIKEIDACRAGVSISLNPVSTKM